MRKSPAPQSTGRRRQPRPGPSPEAADRTTYVYCVVARRGPITLRGLPSGVPGGSRPMLVPLTPRLSIVVSIVPREAYAPEAIEPRLRDLDWVSAIALAHEAVVERMMRAAGVTVIPMKLFTMFSEPERAVAELRQQQRQLERIVRGIRGADEWGVRITAVAAAPARRRRAAAAATGTAFLAARKQARDEVRERSDGMREAAADTLASLRRLAQQTTTRPAPEGAGSPPLLDAAFLVSRRRTARFRAAVKRAAAHCREAGADLALSGPWPPYNFVGSGDSA